MPTPRTRGKVTVSGWAVAGAPVEKAPPAPPDSDAALQDRPPTAPRPATASKGSRPSVLAVDDDEAQFYRSLIRNGRVPDPSTASALSGGRQAGSTPAVGAVSSAFVPSHDARRAATTDDLGLSLSDDEELDPMCVPVLRKKANSKKVHTSGKPVRTPGSGGLRPTQPAGPSPGRARPSPQRRPDVSSGAGRGGVRTHSAADDGLGLDLSSDDEHGVGAGPASNSPGSAPSVSEKAKAVYQARLEKAKVNMPSGFGVEI